jgi:hypothetical protein
MTLILSGTDGLSDIDGTAATPAVRGTDANTGIFFGTDIIGFSEGGVEAMRVNSAGAVLVNTTSQTASTRMVVADATGNGQIRAIHSTGLGLNINQASASGAAFIQQQDNADLGFSTNNTEQARITAAGLFQFNSGYGSVATAYGCRAWVNFKGTATVTILASGNVTSITDNGTGDYTVNFTTAMPDANYFVSNGGSGNGTGAPGTFVFVLKGVTAPTTTAVRIASIYINGSYQDGDPIGVAIFR